MDEYQRIVLIKRSQNQKATYCIIPFIITFWNRKNVGVDQWLPGVEVRWKNLLQKNVRKLFG